MQAVRMLGIPLLLVASAGGAVAAFAAHLGSPLQPLAGFWFLLACPGLAMVRLISLRDRALELILVPAISITLDILVAETLLFAHAWNAPRALLILAFLTVAGALLQVRKAVTAVKRQAGRIIPAHHLHTDETNPMATAARPSGHELVYQQLGQAGSMQRRRSRRPLGARFTNRRKKHQRRPFARFTTFGQ